MNQQDYTIKIHSWISLWEKRNWEMEKKIKTEYEYENSFRSNSGNTFTIGWIEMKLTKA